MLPTVDRLLDTAAGLFWEKGFAATTTRELAAALGIQQASLYYHMESKEDLLYQICVSSLREFLADVPPRIEASARPAEKIDLLIRAHVATLLKHQERNVAMLTELRSLTRRHRIEVVELRSEYAAFVRSVLAEAQSAGRIRSDISANFLALALLNLMNWSALWFRQGRALSSDQLADLFIRIFAHGTAAPRARLPVVSPVQPNGRKAPRARKPAKSSDTATVDRLLDAAVALFSRKGYTATSTREVASLLGIQKASLYYHIQSKEDLLFLVCKSSLTRILSDVQSAIHDTADPLERIAAMIRAHVESMLRDAGEHSSTLAEMHALSPKRLAQVVSLRDAYEGFVKSVLQEGQNSGALRTDLDVKYLSLCLLGMMNRVLVWYRRGGTLSPAQIGHMLAAVFLSGAACETPASSTGR